MTLRLKVKTSPAMQWEVARELRIATRDVLERADVPLAGQRDLMATHRAPRRPTTRPRGTRATRRSTTSWPTATPASPRPASEPVPTEEPAPTEER